VGETGENDLVFTKDGEPIVSFLKAWRNACVRAAIPTTLDNMRVIGHFSRGADCCVFCADHDVTAGKYVGFLFHDLQRTFVSNAVEAGLDPIDAMHISGHKTDAVFRRYNIKSEDRARRAGEKLAEHLRKKHEEAQAEPNPMLKRTGANRRGLGEMQ
jgi:hypothetical protein